MSSRTRRISYLASISLLLSFVELMLPRPVPFMKLGLSNVALLLALDLGFPDYMLLVALKAIGGSYVSGTLFSFFLLMSLLQSASSGLTMYILHRIAPKRISLYGLSVAGATASTYAQAFLASAYLGKGVLCLLPLMLLSSFVSSLVVAFIGGRIAIPEHVPEIAGNEDGRKLDVLSSSALAWAVFVSTFLDSIPLLLLCFLSALVLMALSGRRIRILPFVSLAAVSVFSAILTPSGEVMAEVFSFPICKESVATGLKHFLTLASTLSLSLAFSKTMGSLSFLSDVLLYFSLMEEKFQREKGSIWERFNASLTIDDAPINDRPRNNMTAFTSIMTFVAYSIFLTINFI